MKITRKSVPGRSAAAAAASILFLTGCGPAEPTATDPATPVTAGASAAATTALAMAEDCKAAVAPFRALVKTLIGAAFSGGATDSGDQHTATRKALTGYAATARKEAARVSDPALRTALDHHATAAVKLSTATDPTELDSPDLTSAGDEIEKVCRDALTPTVPPGTPTVRLGAAGSACALPVAFDLLPLWKPKAVDLRKLGELADLYRNGPFEVVCEVDAKPAGEVGFLRVHTAPGRTGSPRSNLEAFIAAESPAARKAGNFEVKKIEYTDLTIAGRPASEVTYETYNKSMDHSSKYSAFAVNTPQGAVVVTLSPFGADEHANVLPAFTLAMQTLTLNR